MSESPTSLGSIESALLNSMLEEDEVFRVDMDRKRSREREEWDRVREHQEQEAKLRTRQRQHRRKKRAAASYGDHKDSATTSPGLQQSVSSPNLDLGLDDADGDADAPTRRGSRNPELGSLNFGRRRRRGRSQTEEDPDPPFEFSSLDPAALLANALRRVEGVPEDSPEPEEPAVEPEPKVVGDLPVSAETIRQLQAKIDELSDTSALLQKLRHSESVIRDLREEISQLKDVVRRLREQSLDHIAQMADSEEIAAQVADLPDESRSALKRASVNLGSQVGRQEKKGNRVVKKLRSKVKRLEDTRKRMEREKREHTKKEKRLAAQVGSLEKKLAQLRSRSADSSDRGISSETKQAESELAQTQKKHQRARTLSKRRFGLFFRKDVTKLEDELQEVNRDLEDQKKEVELLKKLLLTVQSPQSIYYCAKTDIRKVLPIVMKHVMYAKHNKTRMMQEIEHHEYLCGLEESGESSFFVKLYGHIDFPSENRFTLILERMHGDMLDVLLSKTDPVPLGQRVLCLADAADALAAVHAEGRCHLDIKPQNCFVNRLDKEAQGEEGEGEGEGEDPDASPKCRYNVKLGDFGEVRVVEEGASFQSSTGTFRYMDPAICDLVETGEPDPDLCSRDVYSFGMTLFHMFTGMPPLDPFMDIQIRSNPFFNPMSLPTKVNEYLRDNPGSSPADLLFADPDQADSLLPKPLLEVIQACLRQDCNSRPSMTEIAEQLRDNFGSVGPFLASKKKKKSVEGVAQGEGDNKELLLANMKREKDGLSEKVQLLEDENATFRISCKAKDDEIEDLRRRLGELQIKNPSVESETLFLKRTPEVVAPVAPETNRDVVEAETVPPAAVSESPVPSPKKRDGRGTRSPRRKRGRKRVDADDIGLDPALADEDRSLRLRRLAMMSKRRRRRGRT